MDFLDRWRSFRTRFERRLKRTVGKDRVLTDALLHDADEEYLHIDYLFPARDGLVFVDLLEYSGRVYGAETLRQWTILDHGRRHVMDNPLFDLQSKKESLRSLLGHATACEGYLVFPDETVVGRDIPGCVVTAATFFASLDGRLDGSGDSPTVRDWNEIMLKIVEHARGSGAA